MIASSKRRILFVSFSLRRGGAERVTSMLLQHLAASPEYELHLALLEVDGPFLNQLPADVAVHSIGTRQPMAALIRLRRLLRAIEPDIVFSNGFPMNLLTASLQRFLPQRPRLVLREVNVLDVLLRRGVARVLLKQTAKWSFRAADAIICQSRFMEQDLQTGLRLDDRKLVTIFNPVDFDSIARQADGPNPLAGSGPGPHVLGVGQLAHKKGFDRIVQAFPKLLERTPTAQLWLVGDGPERTVLERQIADLNLQDRIRLVGTTDNPYLWMRHADLFVLSSRHEGTPNVLLEAIACRTPIVVQDHPGGTREVMQRTGQAWRIVDDLSVWDPRWFEQPPEDARMRAREFLDVSRVAREYVAVLEGEHCRREAA